MDGNGFDFKTNRIETWLYLTTCQIRKGLKLVLFYSCLPHMPSFNRTEYIMPCHLWTLDDMFRRIRVLSSETYQSTKSRIWRKMILVRRAITVWMSSYYPGIGDPIGGYSFHRSLRFIFLQSRSLESPF